MTTINHLNRAVGLLVIEVVNSNPNGDPDRESDPRTRGDGRGEISPVSFKRKLRDLAGMKDGPVWKEVGQGLDEKRFQILETPERNQKAISKLSASEFLETFWDARVFGCTFLEKESRSAIKTGVVQFGLGISVAPIYVERLTNTKKCGVQEGKDKGMAPLGYRIVEHGVYCMPFFVNATAATKTMCSAEDIALMCRLIPFAYSETASYIRTDVRIRHAWYMEHPSPLGTCSDFALLEAMTPRSLKAPEDSTTSWSDYEVPTALPEAFASKVSLKDLMDSDL